MARLAWIVSELGSAIRLSDGNHHTAEASARRGSGVLAGRCVLYQLHSTPLFLTDGIVFTELVNSRDVGKLEVILGADLFGGQIVNALLCRFGS